MAPSLDRGSSSYGNIGALSQLVEAASALTELEVREPSTKKAQSTVLVSDDDEISRITAKANENTTAPSNPRKKEIFPQKLMEILADSTLSEIVSWLPHGRSFVIIRPDLFCEEVLPRYLPPADSRGSTKYPSFTRKLNRWGFRQATRGADTGAFHHPFFRRDQPELCLKMVCQKSRDRQQGLQKQRSLPPKKRSIPDASSRNLCNSNQLLPSIIASADPAATVSAIHPAAQVVAPVSSDDRSVGNSSTTSHTSSNANSMPANNRNKYIAAVKINSPLAPSAPPITAATLNSKTILSSARKITGASGLMPFISNDSKFVASTLKQRESMEVYRAAKAMLYDAYMKAINEEPR